VKGFAYVNATNEKEALAALVSDRGKALPIGGGQDLLALMKDYVLTPDSLVNVKGLPTTIAVPVGPAADFAVIGAAVRLADLAGHAAVKKAFPALAHAAAEVGTPQIRNVGTVGGNLCQRPRCWYFRNEDFPCLKKGGARCFAVDGENQFHAIFGDAPCHIVHPSSLAVPLVAFGASIRVAGPSGQRDVSAGEFFVMPDRNMYGETVLAPNELVTEVRVPIRPAARSAHYEVRFKQSHDWPIAFATVVLEMAGQTVRSARVVMGAVAPIPWRAEAAEQVLAGEVVTSALAERAADAAVAGAKPMTGNAYKVQVARTAVKRAILETAGLEQGA